MAASVILTNWSVFYSTDTGASGGYKQIRWTGAGAPETNTNTINELYSALADLFSIAAQNEAFDTIPIQAVTPTVYNIGAFDEGDLEPWFIDPVSVQHLTGGSLQTVRWTRVVNADVNLGNPGIVKVTYTTGTQFVASDIGRNIVHASGDTGTLLYFANNEAWIRPTNCTSTHNWDTGSGIFSVTAAGGTGSVTQTAASTKSSERLWSNIYTIGSIYSGTSIYVVQNYTKIPSFWSTGHIDRLFLTTDGFASGLIDRGLLTIYAREYGYLYDHYDADVSTGGRNPIPLATSADINNETVVGTISALTGITFTFGENTHDLLNDNGSRKYDVEINCGGNTLSDFYEYTKYLTQRTSTTSLNGHDGEQYTTVGFIRISFDTQTANFAKTYTLTGTTSGATGIIVASHDDGTTGQLIVRDVRGTFVNGETITDNQGTPGTAAILDSAGIETTLVSKTAPFGTFAGGNFFGARGVFIYNMIGADANYYELIDSSGTSQSPPETVNLTVTIVDTDGVAITNSCEITIVRDSDKAILFNSENVTTGSTIFNITSYVSTLTYINVLTVTGYQPRSVNNYVLPSTSSILTVQLDEDRFYNNP